jgi:hypothetical protein
MPKTKIRQRHTKKIFLELLTASSWELKLEIFSFPLNRRDGGNRGSKTFRAFWPHVRRVSSDLSGKSRILLAVVAGSVTDQPPGRMGNQTSV